ncbi:hypothetical protein BpHYR1_014105 [Brachionus plicatilis]|uniref:Uncharacterized protein n=1 Tax=Brachionus plicatilis TaxID=10195 RepID=A0A3M7PA92_BRAPC|nr:hypothetical protein BpHYR1_014105 [Brachionus plicatilis]
MRKIITIFGPFEPFDIFVSGREKCFVFFFYLSKFTPYGRQSQKKVTPIASCLENQICFKFINIEKST